MASFRYVFFTKLIREQSIPQVAATLRDLGMDGADLCVRDGYPVTPSTARAALKPAVERLAQDGLSVPLVTAPTDLTDASSADAENLFAACHDAGVPNIKLGYFAYRRDGDYWAQVDAARKQIEGFARLATRFGVKACLHTHSGSNLGLNASAAMHLAKGFTPAQVGVYLDQGHLNVCGEPPAMAVDIVREYLCLAAIKDSVLLPKAADGKRRSQFLPVGAGTVEWDEVLRALLRVGFAGAISLHSEYDSPSTEARLAQTKKDLAYLKRIETAVRKEPGV
jgi:sugar phosphate isomerase/epimerase